MRVTVVGSGFVTTMMIASGEVGTKRSTTSRTIPAFLPSRSIRLIPG